MIVAGMLELIVGFYITTGMADIFTQDAINAQYEIPEGMVQITSIADGFLWPVWLFTSMPTWLGGAVGLTIIAVLLAIIIFLYMRNRRAWEIVAGAQNEE